MKQPARCKRENLPSAQCFNVPWSLISIALFAMWLLAPSQIQLSVAQAQPSVTVPGFWDPRRRPERPDTSRIAQIRFLTEFDYPPFNYAGSDGQPAGLSVRAARA